MNKSWCLLLMPVLIFVQVININVVAAFNLDTINYIRYEGQYDAMFGFSVALHREYDRTWVIIGAPQADTSSIQNGVRRGGAVYRCDISDDNRCQIIPFDTKGNQHNDNNEQIDTKSRQWFGATVASNGLNGTLVACAPRYVFHMMQPRKVERNEPVGTCYISRNNFQVITEYSPCRTMYWGYHRQGSCQAGLSAAVTHDGERLFIGAPGSWYWQGQVFSINTRDKFPYKPPRYAKFGEGGGQGYSFDLNNPRNKVWSTGESTSVEDDSYLGYSSITGDFNGDGEQGVAVGMPRGGGLLGKIVIFHWNMTNQENITGEQIGAYFGYSLCAVDVDGDKLDDLIIGAPMYTEPNNEGKYETGRVYIMFQDKHKRKRFQALSTRDGVKSRGRFGLALTSLGDINLDGFGDFAVGAPYGGPEGRGAVYIYHGSPTGPLEKHSQVIFAEDVEGTPDLTTFGFSMSGGVDLDGNLYPDFVVGAYEANKAIVFKSRPVAVMEANTEFETSSKLISLDEKKCTTVRDRKQVTCVMLKSCLRYFGENLPRSIDIEVSWVLDAKKLKSPRMFLLTDEGKNIRNSTMRLFLKKTECRSERVYIIDNLQDKLTPFEVEMHYQLRSVLSTERKKRAILEPVLDQNRGTMQSDSINIQKNCGPDNICIPDLVLTITTVDKYLLGSKELLVVEVLVVNQGEDAFETTFWMNIPESLDFKKVEKIGDSSISCTAPTASIHTLKCDIGNPLPSKKISNFKVILIPSLKTGLKPAFDFYMEVNSTNDELVGSKINNIVKKSIGVEIKTDLSIEGIAVPQEIHYTNSQYTSLENATTEHDLGPLVAQVYRIVNNGPSTIASAEIFIVWPRKTKEGDHLMYLLNQPETSENVKCDKTVFANERLLKLNETLAKKSYIRSVSGLMKTSFSSAHQQQSFNGQSTSSSSSYSSNFSSSSSGSEITEEQRKILDAEEHIESTGDASHQHSQRAGFAAAEVAAAGSNVHHSNFRQGGGDGSHSFHEWRTTSQDGSPPVVVTSVLNRTTAQDRDGRHHFTESSTEHYVSTGMHRQVSNDKHTSYDRENWQHGLRNQGYGRDQNFGKTDSRTQTGIPRTNRIEDFPVETYVNQDLSENIGQDGFSNRRRMKSQQDGEDPRADLITGVMGFEKVAQGESGFYTGGARLETLTGSQNPTRQSQSSYQFSQSGYTTPHTDYSQNVQYRSGSTIHGTNVHQKTNTNSEDLIPDYYDDDDENYDAHHQNAGNYASHHHQSPPSTMHSQRQGYPNNEQQYNYNKRFKRDFDNDAGRDLEKALQCTTANCEVLRCVTGPIANEKDAWISIRTRVLATTLNKLSSNVPINMSTMAVARVMKFPSNWEQESAIKNYETKFRLIPELLKRPEVIPLWVVVLSACAGTIILLLLILLLYKCGFFNRNRPSDSSERQPLNRNGNYHGDEHL